MCFRLWPSLQTLYWSLYGQIHYEDLTIEHDALSAETVVGLILFSFWSLVSVIVLLNMLIAVANEAFDRVKKASLNESVAFDMAHDFHLCRRKTQALCGLLLLVIS